MYEIGQFLAEFKYEYCRICVVSVVRVLVSSKIDVDVVVLVVRVVRVCLVVWYV